MIQCDTFEYDTVSLDIIKSYPKRYDTEHDVIFYPIHIIHIMIRYRMIQHCTS